MQRVISFLSLMIWGCAGLLLACGQVTMSESDAASLPDCAVLPDSGQPSSMAFGVGGPDDDVPSDIAIGSDGSIHVIGQFTGWSNMINLGGDDLEGAGAADIFVVKYGPSGEHVWSRVYGSPEPDRGQAIAVDEDGDVYVTGTFRQSIDLGGGPITSNGHDDIFVAKLAGVDGSHLWSFGIGGSSAFDASNDLVVDPAGDVIVVGYFRGTINFGGGERTSNAGSIDMFVAKYDGAVGEHRWSLVHGGASGDGAEAVALDGSDILVTGFLLSDDASFGGAILGREGDRDLFMARYQGSNGQHQWSVSHGGEGSDEAAAIASQGGRLVITGRYTASPTLGGAALPVAEQSWANAFVALYDAPTGSHLSSAGYGGSGMDESLAVAMAPDGAVVIGGSFASQDGSFGTEVLEHKGGSDVVIARYRGDTGEPLWTLAAGSPGLDAATAVSARGDVLVVAGYFEDMISIAGMDVASPAGGQRDMFIVRLQEE